MYIINGSRWRAEELKINKKFFVVKTNFFCLFRNRHIRSDLYRDTLLIIGIPKKFFFDKTKNTHKKYFIKKCSLHTVVWPNG